MKARALAPLLALPLAALACGSNVAVDGLFGTSTGVTTTGGAGGGDTVTSPIGTGGGAPTTGTATGTTTTGTTTTGTTGTTTTGTTTSTTSTGAGGGVPACDGLGDACTGCMSGACPAAWCGCAENPDCIALLQCAGGCKGDPDCAQQCYATWQDGIAAAVLVSDCAGTSCNAECKWGQPIGDCQTCIVTDCAPEYDACIGDGECLALYQCLTGCDPGSVVCQQGCYDQHGDGVPHLQALLDCSKASCTGVCN